MSRSLFSALFETFCLTARAYLNTQKYGLFCSLLQLGPITRTLDNSNRPLTRRNFCFPSDHFYIMLPSITQTMQ